MSELVTICVDCGMEFSEADGWVDRCAMCCVVLEDHGAGGHAAYVLGCILCDDGGADLRRALQAA